MITLQLLQQIIVFFLMMACGFASGKTWTDRCEKQQDALGHLHLHHHAMRDDQCFSD